MLETLRSIFGGRPKHSETESLSGLRDLEAIEELRRKIPFDEFERASVFFAHEFFTQHAATVMDVEYALAFASLSAFGGALDEELGRPKKIDNGIDVLFTKANEWAKREGLSSQQINLLAGKYLRSAKGFDVYSLPARTGRHEMTKMMFLAANAPGPGKESSVSAPRSNSPPAPPVVPTPAKRRTLRDMFDEYRIEKSDMTAFLQISAFAWKYAGKDPVEAVEYAMKTIFLSRNGDANLRADADATWNSAIAWSQDNGFDAVVWGEECLELATRPRRS